jgi:hypothetical protein
MASASDYVRLVALWGMIPLTLFASRPATGCTCASGEYRLFCAAHLPDCHGTQECFEDGARHVKGCCQQAHRGSQCADCCVAGNDFACTVEGGSSGQQCCNPDTGNAATVVSAVTFPIDDDDHQVDSPAVDSAVADVAVARRISHDTGPPGGDLVISLRRLLI